MIRFLRDPFFYFLLAGGALFIGYTTFGAGGRPAEREIVIDEAELRALASIWRSRVGTAPDAQQHDALVEAHTGDRLMVEEAVARGLHLQDATVRDRLTSALHAAWEEEAASIEPTLEQLRAVYDADPTRYHDAMELTFSHRFFDPGLHGEAARSVAGEATTALAEGRSVVDDPFPDAKTVTVRSHAGMAERFGEPFATALLEHVAHHELGRWIGPVPSTAGWHAVRIDRYTPDRLLPFDEARARVRRDWRRDFIEQNRERRLAALRARHPVALPSRDAPSDPPAAP